MDGVNWADIWKGFGVASPVIILLIWLLIRAEFRADRNQRKYEALYERYLDKLPIIAEIARDAAKALDVANRRIK